MAKKIVRYNGKTLSMCQCTAPWELVLGKEYFVLSWTRQDGQILYRLKDIEGLFDSCWFEPAFEPAGDNFMSLAQTTVKESFLAIAHSVPSIGQRFKCERIEIWGGVPKLKGCFTTTVLDVLYIGGNIFRITTRQSVYIVHVRWKAFPEKESSLYEGGFFFYAVIIILFNKNFIVLHKSNFIIFYFFYSYFYCDCGNSFHYNNSEL